MGPGLAQFRFQLNFDTAVLTKLNGVIVKRMEQKKKKHKTDNVINE